jgi:hypothetical protein
MTEKKRGIKKSRAEYLFKTDILLVVIENITGVDFF